MTPPLGKSYTSSEVQDWQKDKQEGEAQLILEVAVQGPDKP
jgi:hypothetical protein